MLSVVLSLICQILKHETEIERMNGRKGISYIVRKYVKYGIYLQSMKHLMV